MALFAVPIFYRTQVRSVRHFAGEPRVGATCLHRKVSSIVHESRHEVQKWVDRLSLRAISEAVYNQRKKNFWRFVNKKVSMEIASDRNRTERTFVNGIVSFVRLNRFAC